MFLIGAYWDAEPSPEHPLSQSLDALDRRGLLRRVNLQGHTRNDVASFIEVTAGLSPPEELVEAVYTQTEGNPLFITEVIRLLGILAQTKGHLYQSAGHFQDALEFCREAGYRPELAWTCCDYADMLRERNGDGDKVLAIALLDESLAISSELGMRPLMERVLARRDFLSA